MHNIMAPPLQPCSPKLVARTESLEKNLFRPISASDRFWLRSLQWVQFLLTCVFCVVAALSPARFWSPVVASGRL
eukprot:SAG11_NODE_555_length_8566_cov_15.547774_2_plen_75_part_00